MKMRNLLVGLTVVSLIMGSTFSSSVAYAETIPSADEPVISELTVMSFDELPEAIKVQNLQVGGSINQISFPTSLSGVYQNGERVTVSPVTWKIDKEFSSRTVDTFTFTAVFPDTYAYNSEIVAPTIKVNVNKAITAIRDLRLSISKTGGTALSDAIQIRAAYGRVLYLQKYYPKTSTWKTMKTYTLSNVMTQNLTIYFPKEWYSMNEVNTSWRIYMPETTTGSKYISPTIKVTALRAYQNPTAYYQIRTSVTLRSNAGYTLRYGSMGLKVAMVQRKLGMGYIWEIIGPTTYSKIKAYQKSKGLTQTGNVDYGLWKKMGFSDYTWYYKAAYVSPMRTNLGSTKSQLIESFIANAFRYIGTEYIVGAAGEPKSGIDCSGLVMQSMYATGLDPYPISVIRHSQPGYEYESRNFWASSKLKTVATSDRRRGDLIFYQNRSGVVIHVAIYLGNNKVIESIPSGVRVSALISTYSSIKGVKRVFN